MRLVVITGLVAMLSACVSSQKAVYYDRTTGAVIGCKMVAGGSTLPLIDAWSLKEDPDCKPPAEFANPGHGAPGKH